MNVVATICSKEKNIDSELMPAHERYLGDHVRAARTVAEDSTLPLYILSGKFGLISGDDIIPDYDYYLEKETEELINLVASQMQEAGISEIEFYHKDKEAWKPYASTLTSAARQAGVQVRKHAI